ncbi:MAG: Hpt domain-containing protein [Pseudodesulfovibrio sp.]|jgi:HPt (histidine-containing phosphotransfer) domain-containing protein|uniref:HPt (Histidine-containing phosphotransfer) domain-containing protein n=1 Tax=Pseudodesulfovibrio indicus TaxID=1716143 RepID=A0A140D9J5_9BACT|nr:Hpt domain-containing protein [Pseudodesulfovibrio indicus]AMK09862.1 hypothetical protein AWY79_01420 [Pseudodesulfovibrio indicus]TDT87460.1 HPt (histidine-containing phosphotransfer) domain-containing protein [Pseudodesulfovibrio indicus]
MTDQFNPSAPGEGASGFDADAAREDMGLSDEEFALLAGRAREEIAARLEAVRQGFRESDLPGVALNSHTIKSVAASLGAEGVRRVAERLELCAREGDADRCSRHLPSMEGEAGWLLKVLGRL